MVKISKRKKLHNKLRLGNRKKRERSDLKRLNIPLKKSNEFASQNHYVPQWYQKRFLIPNVHHFHYMDLNPKIETRPDGKTYSKEFLRLGPARCFKQEHLYTLELFNHKSDIIEKELFGNIDARGTDSFDIFLGADAWMQSNANDKFNNFIEFMDVQKLRTPKGMNFIKSLCLLHKQTPNKLLVLGLLQKYRKMHCAMWIESIWEVVNAKESIIKFIISDHPVTTYNPKILTPVKSYEMPIDPPISLLGTHTIYPLDLNHCLILTHRQYALAPDQCNPLEDRINARYGDKAIFNFQDIIHERNLNDHEVAKINYITKKSALRYIASQEKSWLYPENNVQCQWEELGNILLPPKDKITLTQSIVFGHRDGSTEAYDAFGRDISAQEHGEFNEIAKKITLGDELSKILKNDSKTDLHKKSMVLLESIKAIFEISNKKTIEDIKKDINEDQVRKLYHVVAEIFPYRMDFCSLIPTESKFRGVFLGDIHSLTITRDICNIIHFFDEIYIINPFQNPHSIKDDFSPLRKPKQFLRDTYNLILSFLMLESFIKDRLLTIIPAPDDFDYSLKMKILRMAEKRTKTIKFDNSDFLCSEVMDNEIQKLIRSFPKEYLRTHIRKISADASDDDVTKVLEYFEEQSQRDITDLGRSIEETGPQLLITRSGLNLESTLIFCRLTGAVPVTYTPFKYKEFLAIANNASGCKRWNPLIKLFNNADLVFDGMGDPIFNHFLESEGFFSCFREYLNKIYKSVLLNNPKTHPQNLRTLCQRLPAIQKQYSDDWHAAVSVYEEWFNRLPEEVREKIPFKPCDIFKKGNIKLILGNLNHPLIDHLLSIHFSQKERFDIVPMALFLDRQVEINKSLTIPLKNL